MERNHKTISPTAFNHIIFRTHYGLPLADKFAEAAEKFSPPEHLFSRETIRNNSPIFEGRYKGGEQAIEKFAKKNPNCVVLELAAGFSLHGADLVRKYPKMKYIETDLSEIIKMKEKIIKEIRATVPNIFFKSANALDPAAMKKIVSRIPSSRKIAVYCEGLLSYFDDNEKKKIAGIIHSILEKNGGIWITPDPALDINARKALKRLLPSMRRAVSKAGKMAGRKLDNHGFRSEEETDKLFHACGFLVRKYAWPVKFNAMRISGLDTAQKESLKKILKKHGKTWVMSVQ
ncbi:MAG: class I SAM-dependent methyltransferase [Candidatus Moranbacteria bacterium]|nr:class I SAM-dependent methyltransferase [Candidatus Moranbacteria bacterium]